MNSRLTGIIPRPCTAPTAASGMRCIHLDHRHHRFLDSGAFQLHPEYIFRSVDRHGDVHRPLCRPDPPSPTDQGHQTLWTGKGFCLILSIPEGFKCFREGRKIFFEVWFFRNLNHNLDFPELGSHDHKYFFDWKKVLDLRRLIKIASQ